MTYKKKKIDLYFKQNIKTYWAGRKLNKNWIQFDERQSIALIAQQSYNYHEAYNLWCATFTSVGAI